MSCCCCPSAGAEMRIFWIPLCTLSLDVFTFWVDHATILEIYNTESFLSLGFFVCWIRSCEDVFYIFLMHWAPQCPQCHACSVPFLRFFLENCWRRIKQKFGPVKQKFGPVKRKFGPVKRRLRPLSGNFGRRTGIQRMHSKQNFTEKTGGGWNLGTRHAKQGGWANHPDCPEEKSSNPWGWWHAEPEEAASAVLKYCFSFSVQNCIWDPGTHARPLQSLRRFHAQTQIQRFTLWLISMHWISHKKQDLQHFRCTSAEDEEVCVIFSVLPFQIFQTFAPLLIHNFNALVVAALRNVKCGNGTPPKARGASCVSPERGPKLQE